MLLLALPAPAFFCTEAWADGSSAQVSESHGAVPVRAGDKVAGSVEVLATPTPGVEAIVSMRQQQVNSPEAAPRRATYSLTVDTASDWFDTGVTVSAGQQVAVEAQGSALLGDGRTSGPGGLERGWKDMLRQLPSQGAKTGELIGRVSEKAASVPFPMGAGGTVTMPTSGRLYLRSNVSTDLHGTGSYQVSLRFSDSKAPGHGDEGDGPAISSLVSPSTFTEVPRRVRDEAGSAGDMVNFALAGSEAQVKAAFRTAGWVPVDKSVSDAVLHGLLSTLSREAYTEMPMSTLFLFGRAQDLSFARGDPLTIAAERHHLRVWRTAQTVAGVPLWVGSATHDIGFERDQRNGRTTHRIDPRIDDERQFLLESFDATGAFLSAAYVTPANPLRTAETATGGSFFSDGRVLVLQLK